jgi:hypothetical protein
MKLSKLIKAEERKNGREKCLEMLFVFGGGKKKITSK